MPLTLEETQARIDALETALASGTHTVTFSDRSVTYRSIKELIDALQYFKGVQSSLSTDSVPRQTFGTMV